MTKLFSRNVECSVCGKSSQHKALMSTNALGSMDLDTRPPEMKRSTMHCWVSKCPHCGYAASSLEEPLRCDREFLKSSEYKNFMGQPPVSGLAKRFIHKARISTKEGNYVAAFFDYVHAAWASDDEGDEAWLIELRMLAMQMMEKFDIRDMKDVHRVMRADLLRKTRQFERLVQEYENVHFEDDLLNKIVQFQILKAKDKDTATYTLGHIQP